MDLRVIGPDRHHITHLSRIWLTLADFAGLAIGAAVATAVLALLFL